MPDDVKRGDPLAPAPGGSPPLSDPSALARLVTEHAADAIILLDQEGRTTFANPAAEAMFGWSEGELRGKPLRDLIHARPADETAHLPSPTPIDQVFATGRSLKVHEDVFFRRDGTPVPIACSIAAIAPDGEVTGAVLIARDGSERHEAEKQRQLRLGELNHRIKNTLAVVQSIALQSFKSGDMRTSRAAFERRLAALAAAHDVLIETSWTAASLDQAARRALYPFSEGDRVEISGDEVQLSAKVCVAVMIGLHELATNASKYGALSNESGHVSVHWEVRKAGAEPMLHLLWSETGGPLVQKPTGRGFGSRMIQALASELNGKVEISFDPEGLKCRLEAPLPVV